MASAPTRFPAPTSRQTSTHLDAASIERFGELLVAERAAQVAMSVDHGATAHAQALDPEQPLGAALAAQAMELVADIDAALGRLARGEYGICEGCGDHIPLERLEAVPYASRCVSCPPPGAWVLP